MRLVARFGSSRSRFGPFMVGSAAVHVLLVVVLFLLPLFKGRAEIRDSFPVELVAQLPGSSDPQPAAAPPAQPEPPPKPAEGVHVETTEPVQVDKPKKKPPKEDPPPAPTPGPPPDAPARENPAPGEAGGGPPGADAGSSIVPMEGGDVAFAWYRASVTAALFGQWRRPILAGMRDPLEVGIRFEILRDGRVRDIRIDRPSGVPSLDRSALRAVSDASPLPALPPNWREPSLPAAFVFRLYPEDR